MRVINTVQFLGLQWRWWEVWACLQLTNVKWVAPFTQTTRALHIAQAWEQEELRRHITEHRSKTFHLQTCSSIASTEQTTCFQVASGKPFSQLLTAEWNVWAENAAVEIKSVAFPDHWTFLLTLSIPGSAIRREICLSCCPEGFRILSTWSYFRHSVFWCCFSKPQYFKNLQENPSKPWINSSCLGYVERLKEKLLIMQVVILICLLI